MNEPQKQPAHVRCHRRARFPSCSRLGWKQPIELAEIFRTTDDPDRTFILKSSLLESTPPTSSTMSTKATATGTSLSASYVTSLNQWRSGQHEIMLAAWLTCAFQMSLRATLFGSGPIRPPSPFAGTRSATGVLLMTVCTPSANKLANRSRSSCWVTPGGCSRRTPSNSLPSRGPSGRPPKRRSWIFFWWRDRGGSGPDDELGAEGGGVGGFGESLRGVQTDYLNLMNFFSY